MSYNEIAGIIIDLCRNDSLSFQKKGEYLENLVSRFTTDEILEHLYFAGVIPESFGHDSTEEKVFAKYCDCLLAACFRELGLETRVLEERGDAADVFGRGENYTIVGDAKAFRLSRTAKNQKDFKVEALDRWRAGADYACLLAPIYQYPAKSSQIYRQAIRYNVTLLSYTHMAFLISAKKHDLNLSRLWNLGSTLKGRSGESKEAGSYWDEILNVLLSLTGQDREAWDEHINITLSCLQKQIEQQIGFLEFQRKLILAMDHKTAIGELIKERKIDEKILIINKYK